MNIIQVAQYLYAQVRSKWPVNRVVVALTPLVFAPLAGFITAWVAVHFPGLPALDPNVISGIFVTGAGTALAAAYKFLDGWQKYEAQVASPDLNPMPAPGVKSDAAADLSEPDDIAESDADLGDDPERVPDRQ